MVLLGGHSGGKASIWTHYDIINGITFKNKFSSACLFTGDGTALDE